MKDLRKLASMIGDLKLRGKVEKLIEKPKFKIFGVKSPVGLPLDKSPGGKFHHHAYEAGLLQHTVAMTRLALSLCDIAESVYGGKVNRDVVVAACLLHDLMKAPTYAEKENGEYASSPLGERLNHLSLITAELYRRKFPLEVIHSIAAHHGEAGPIFPRTLEALIVHLADLTDSKLNGEVLKAARRLIKEATGREAGRIDSKEAFEIVRAKSAKGLDGVRETVEKMEAPS